MSILLLPPPPLLLLLAALVAPATSVTTYRPDWNRLRGLARGRVEVSAPFRNLSTTVHNPAVPHPGIQSTLGSGILEFPTLLSPFLLHGPGIIPFISQPQDAQHPLWE